MTNRIEVGALRRMSPLPVDGLDLAVRQSDGVEVALYWSRSSGRTWIDARDLFTDARLVLETIPDRALDAYYDSYAYLLGGRSA